MNFETEHGKKTRNKKDVHRQLETKKVVKQRIGLSFFLLGWVKCRKGLKWMHMFLSLTCVTWYAGVSN